jgi:hypothetical protein
MFRELWFSQERTKGNTVTVPMPFRPSETDRDVRFCAAIPGVPDIAPPASTFNHLTITSKDRAELYAMSWFDGAVGR